MFIVKKNTRIIIATLAIVISGIAAILGWTYLAQKTSAADMSKFDPGNIMSDAVMSNKDSMSVQQIQAFLNSKNACNNTNTYMASWYPHLQYTIRDGKFVCMAQDTFNGKSAAQIIWQVGQDYNINPQFLIVLLEKEQGLVADTWPNHVQYRSATGFGCPDTAACDSKYFGLENQLVNAANLFRTVLNGGWSNYPVGWTYVQYNPNASCGGKVINIQNRATSALYRYTPYQPNQSAINAGYGLGDSCGAYGNRNTWALFTDWFGSTQKDIFIEMDSPRKLIATIQVNKIDPMTNINIPDQSIQKGQVVFYSSKTVTKDNKLCLRTESNTLTNWNMCVLYEALQESPQFTTLAEPITLRTKEASYKVDPIDSTPIPGQVLPVNALVTFSSRSYTLKDGKECLRTESNTLTNWNMCVLKEDLHSPPSFSLLPKPTTLVSKKNLSKINPLTGESIANQVIPKGIPVIYTSSITTLKDGKECLRTESNTLTNWNMCVLKEDLHSP